MINQERIVLLRKRIAEAPQHEQWKIDHHDTQRLAKLEDFVSYYCWVYDRAIALDAYVHESAFNGELGPDEYNQCHAQMQEVFEMLLEKGTWAEEIIPRFKEQGYDVANADKFRICRGQLIAMMNPRGVVEGELSQLRDEAIEQNRAGETADLEWQ